MELSLDLNPGSWSLRSMFLPIMHMFFAYKAVKVDTWNTYQSW